MKKWKILNKLKKQNSKSKNRGQSEKVIDDLVSLLLENRGIKTSKGISHFLHSQDPYELTPQEVGIDTVQLHKALSRIEKAIKNKESMVVYADYDADGVTAGTIMWETLYRKGASVMPFIPHRVEEGYGLSIKGIDHVKQLYNPSLIITVDHGITGWEKVAYAKSQGIEVIVTDHHVKPDKLPDCTIVHTTQLCGAGVSWFVAKESLSRLTPDVRRETKEELLALAAIGTIADMVPLTNVNRSIAKFGLAAINKTTRVGLNALLKDAGIKKGEIEAYHVSHLVAPRLNAMGRLDHAMDALRLLCTPNELKAQMLAHNLGLTNRERQQLTEETTIHAKELVDADTTALRKLLFIAHGDYNPGVIGLVAGKLVETYYLPSIVIAKGDTYSKASARSIHGFNIIEAIRSCADILVDAGGHPMAAGFTVETTKLELLKERLQELALSSITDEMLIKTLKVDCELPFENISEDLWREIQNLAPFGVGNYEPVFATKNVQVADARQVGTDGRHLKLKLKSQGSTCRDTLFDAIGFGMGEFYDQLEPSIGVDAAYSVDFDTWNGSRRLQLKLKDIKNS